jgi:hypothetical protein
VLPPGNDAPPDAANEIFAERLVLFGFAPYEKLTCTAELPEPELGVGDESHDE